MLDTVAYPPEEVEQYAVLTASFGEFIGLKDCAYIDVNNCPFADQLLAQGIAESTPYTKQSGFCTYPLWHFNGDFLKDIGASNYEKYSAGYKYKTTRETMKVISMTGTKGWIYHESESLSDSNRTGQKQCQVQEL